MTVEESLALITKSIAERDARIEYLVGRLMDTRRELDESQAEVHRLTTAILNVSTITDDTLSYKE